MEGSAEGSLIATDPLDSKAAFYINHQETIDEENNQALKLNAYVARGLHDKKIACKTAANNWDVEDNPLVAFRNHFNLFRSFTDDIMGEKLWEELLPIVNDPSMPKKAHNYWG